MNIMNPDRLSLINKQEKKKVLLNVNVINVKLYFACCLKVYE